MVRDRYDKVPHEGAPDAAINRIGGAEFFFLISEMKEIASF
jgi:hypothetical protein